MENMKKNTPNINPIQEIECKACGAFFTPTHHSQKYCECCRQNSHPEKLAAYADRASMRNLAHYSDADKEMRETTCQFCGKVFEYRAKRGCDAVAPEFCSNKCKSENRIAQTVCEYCKKPMLETSDVRDMMGHNWYCSPECKLKSQWAQARANGTVHICPTCGKEFIKNQTFCSKECYKKADKPKEKKPEIYQIACECCHRNILRIKGEPRIDTRYYCRSCREKMEALKQQKRTKEAFNEGKPAKSLSPAISREEQKESDYIEKNGLCALCKTSYVDCERMQTEFRIAPKGVKYKGSRIIECPKFK